MKKLLNILYVSTQGTYLHKEGETVVIEKDKKVLLRLPVHTLSGIVTFGNVMTSPFLLHFCAEQGIGISFMSEYGKFLARVSGPTSGNVHLRIAQMRAYESISVKSNLAKRFVIGKIINTRNILMRRMRDHGECHEIKIAANTLADILRRLKNTDLTIESIRGLEGEAAAIYFQVFNNLLVAQHDAFSIQMRNRRPPTDPMNALLSFLYTLLAHDCRSALEGVGLDPQIGFLHALRSGRPALALDLMEEFRALIADRLALSLVNLRQINTTDFITSESGAVTLKDTARKTVLATWQKKKQETVTHPFIGEPAPIGLLPHLQALLLARHLRGDLDDYPPYLPR